MTRCSDFYDKWKRHPNFCEKSPKTVEEIDYYLSIVEELGDFGLSEDAVYVGFSEGASRPLQKITDEVTRQKILANIAGKISRGSQVTIADVKLWINISEGKNRANASSPKTPDSKNNTIAQESTPSKKEEDNPLNRGILAACRVKNNGGPCEELQDNGFSCRFGRGFPSEWSECPRDLRKRVEEALAKQVRPTDITIAELTKSSEFIPANEIKKNPGLVDENAPDTRTTITESPTKPDKVESNNIPPTSGFVPSVDECILTVKTPPNVANIPPTFPPEIEIVLKRGLQFGIYDRIKGGYARDYQDSILKAIEFWVTHVAEVEE